MTKKPPRAPGAFISVKGACQNNLKNLDLRIPLGELVVVTGVSGSGKSSLAFDTIYAEGQRRYVETFSPYARQFLERMDKPRAARIDGIPAAIAIDQTNPVRTSRSTVGTMTELSDHLKLLYARAARLHCRKCGRVVRRDTAQSVAAEVLADRTLAGPALVIFPVSVPENFSEEEVLKLLAGQGYRRVHARCGRILEVVQDRVMVRPQERERLVEDLEAAMKHGQGRVAVIGLDCAEHERCRRSFSADLHCADCDIHYKDPAPSMFSFNSPIGACETCRGFGRTIGIDYGLVVPDDTKTLAGGAVKPWQSESYRECQDDLMKFARKRGVPTDVPWSALSEEHRRWVLDGEGPWEEGVWYGAKRFFDWLEGRSYRMHVRVLLSRYRTYRECPSCRGARLKPEALLWRIGDGDGMTIHEVSLLPLDQCRAFFDNLRLPAPLDEAAAVLLDGVRTRLAYLVDVGLGYLTLDRQSRTLSGGEVQRINLTTALGTSLVNTLFVLDEPSIGLHPRDIGRLIRVLHRLRDAGNSLLVVEHDPGVIRAADRVIDLGPGPGERGGEVVFSGTIPGLKKCNRSLTGQYLAGRRKVVEDRQRLPVTAETPRLTVRGAAEHNLKRIDVAFPLGRLVCVTGVSGSGKSTLVQDVLYQALRKLKHRPVDTPGAHDGIEGHERIADVALVDQAPIGKTTRSNPASYVGAFDAIRKLFAAAPLSRSRHYGPGTFSFNAGDGRCPACSGNGFQHIEMQFLSDVYLRCPDCDGKRFRAEVLEVRLRGKSVADVLEMTVSEAAGFFAGEREVLRGLEPLQAVGLDYLRLGQPVPALSGGEAQRLKLAGHLAESSRTRGAGTLFLFDEPTTGLHFHDIAQLLRALRALIARGDSVVVIEHNLDVVAAADWIIDLGPEGGEQGGELVCAGTPAQVVKCTASHTGRALAPLLAGQRAPAAGQDRRTSRTVAESAAPGGDGSIRIHNAREHNLKNVDVVIPRDRFTVITGISGSGKSTVAFDILFAEGQRRYLESLNAYARQFVQPAARPDVDAVYGVPPTVAIEQRLSRGGRKSTVATVTEIYHFLRLLFVKLGVQHCPSCNEPIAPQSVDQIVARTLDAYRGKTVEVFAPLIRNRKGLYTDLAAWARGKGYRVLRVDGALTPTDRWPRLDRFVEHSIELPVAVARVTPGREQEMRVAVEKGLELGKGVVYVELPARHGPPGRTVYSTERACPGCGRSFEELDPRLFSYNSRHGWCPSCFGTGLVMRGFDEEQTGEEIWWNDWWGGAETPCPACHGKRLRPEALAVRFRGLDIAACTAVPVTEAEAWVAGLKLAPRELEIARDIVAELRSRLAFLRRVGLPYLTLDRAAPTLSGGEAQRIRLAAQLGSNLRGVCYILDEPTIGLHARDNLMLLETLGDLRTRGNTVVVVEHDETTIRRAEHIVDLGPGAGLQGGEVVAAGTPSQVMRCGRSATGRFLRQPLRHPLLGKRRQTGPRTPAITVVGADRHNLKDQCVAFPLGRLVCVTGVSGSGKSTLVRDVLRDSVAAALSGRRTSRGSAPVHGCRRIEGVERVARVLEVDQTPIGKTPRSCPATYVGVWDHIRRLFASSSESRMRGYTASRFSFNVKGGRCEECEGQGVKRIEMSFLPDVDVPCEACRGRRFTAETCEARFKDRSIADVLAMDIDQATEFFSAHPPVHHTLRLLQDVGLGYLHLGQQSPTLSGGEAQRIKLVTELAKARPSDAGARHVADGRHTLYVLDEPTIGLHMADVERLLRVLHRLVDAGNTVVIIEHNLDIVADADWVIDLGPEGGDGGGRVVALGTPEQVAGVKAGSHTARFLREFLRERGHTGGE